MGLRCKEVATNPKYNLTKFRATGVQVFGCVAHECNIFGKHTIHWCKLCGAKWE